MRWESTGVCFIPRPWFISKDQTHPSVVAIFLSLFTSVSSVEEDKIWCPVCALKWYIECMHEEYQRHHVLTCACRSLQEWVVECFKPEGNDATLSNLVRAHDTRSVNTSCALFNGTSLSDIQKAGFWSNPNPKSIISCT